MMLRKCVMSLALLSGVCLALSSGSGSAASTADRETAVTGGIAATTVNLFAKPMTLSGMLGDAQIEMRLQLKADPTEGIQGTYSMVGQTAKILLAGESENTDVLLEESINGKDVSGEWAGKLVGDTFSGTWSTTDDAVTKPFVLKVRAVKSAKAK